MFYLDCCLQYLTYAVRGQCQMCISARQQVPAKINDESKRDRAQRQSVAKKVPKKKKAVAKKAPAKKKAVAKKAPAKKKK